jgi:hypothetical protein
MLMVPLTQVQKYNHGSGDRYCDDTGASFSQ